MILRVIIPLAVLAAITAAACGGGDDSDESPLLTLLGAIPDAEGSGNYIAYSDLDAYYDALGVNPPPEEASTEEFLQWAEPVVAQNLESIEVPERFPVVEGTELVRQAFTDAGAFRDEIGVDPAVIGQSLLAGQPPHQYYILRGEFDGDRIDAAVKSDPNYSDLLEEASYQGIDYYSWGEEGPVPFSRSSSVRPLGGGGRLALYENLLLWTYWTEGITEMIDAVKGGKSLADRDDVRALAEAVDRLGVYAFEMRASRAAISGDNTILTPYLGIAYGPGIDEQGQFIALIVSCEDEESAEDNAKRIRTRIANGADGLGKPWTQYFDSTEVSTDRSLTIAVFRGPEASWLVALGVITQIEEP